MLLTCMGGIALFAFLINSSEMAYSQTANQTVGYTNVTLQISHPFVLALFTSNIQSPSTIQIFQKYYVHNNDIITAFNQDPSIFNVRNTLFPYFPNQTKAIIVPSIPNVQQIISDVAPSILTKGRDIIFYDSEMWSITPPSEYDSGLPGGQSIVQSISQAADMVHSAGYLFGITPQMLCRAGPSPCLFPNYQEINWNKIDYLTIQAQLLVNTKNGMQEVKQVYQFVKSQSPNTQVLINVGLTKAANVSPSEVISALNKLENFDGVQVIYLPVAECPTCTDINLNSLLDALSISTNNGASSNNPSNETQNQPQYYKIPTWVKHNAQWWADDEIGDEDFLKGIEYLINQGIMVIPTSQPTSATPHGIPIWIKNDAKWWANNEIRDEDFVKGMQFLVASNIIHVSIRPPSNIVSS